MTNVPSYLRSTFSACTIVVIVGLTYLCVKTGNVQDLKEVAVLLLSAYGVGRGVGKAVQAMKGTGNGGG